MEDNSRDLQEDCPAGADIFGFGWGLPEAVDRACYRPIDCAAPQSSARGARSCRTDRSKAPGVPRSGERLLRSGHWKRSGVRSALTSMASLFTMRLELAFQMDMMLAADSFTIREE